MKDKIFSRIKVENMSGSREGKPVANQFIITVDNDRYFQSYDSIIALKRFGKYPQIVLDEHYWNYSTTTSKYRNKFLGEDTKETEKKIKSGEYVLANLN